MVAALLAGNMPLALQQRRLRAVLLFADTLAILVAVLLAGAAWVALDGWAGTPHPVNVKHLGASILVVPVLVLLVRSQGLYELDQILAGTREYARIAHAATYGALSLLVATYVADNGSPVSRSWLVLVWLCSTAALGLERFSARRVVRRARRDGLLRTRVIVVGASTFGLTVARRLVDSVNEGIELVGFLDEFVPIGQKLLGEIAVIGRPGDIVRSVAPQADEYVLVPEALPHERMEELTRCMVSADGPAVRLAVGPTEMLSTGVLVAERAHVPLVTLRPATIGASDAAMKRALDFVGSISGILALTPALILVLVRAYVRGVSPYFDRLDLVSDRGTSVKVWLLRPEVTEWLPLRGVLALLGVLVGRMSLVGPRPVLRGDQTKGTANARADLVNVKPGLTGPWRLMGPSASVADQTKRDLLYVRDYSVWEDFRIILESLRRAAPTSAPNPLGRWQTKGSTELGIPEAVGAGKVSA